MASAEVSTALCKLSRLCSAWSTVSRWMTKREQKAAKSEHLLQDRGFRCFICSCIFIFLFIFAPQQRGGGEAFHYCTQFMQSPSALSALLHNAGLHFSSLANCD